MDLRGNGMDKRRGKEGEETGGREQRRKG